MPFEIVENQKMKMSEKFMLGVVLLISALFVAGILYSQNLESQKADACSKSCGTLKSRMIDQTCHCMTDKGWEKK